MSVQKLNNKSKSFVPVIPFTQIANHVITNIKNAEAFLVWSYLLSKTSDWIVIKSHIKSHFGYGDRKIINIFKYLNERKLITYVTHRTEDGKHFSHTDIQVLDGTQFVTDEQLTKSKPTLSKTYSVDDCTYRNDSTTKQRGLLNKDKKTKERETTQKPREKRGSLPDNFIFEASTMKLLQEISIKVDIEPSNLIKKFTNLCKETNKLSSDWNASFEKFLIDERPRYKSHDGVSGFKEVRSTVKEWGPGHPSYDSYHGLN
jgi:hypothetical protein